MITRESLQNDWLERIRQAAGEAGDAGDAGDADSTDES